MVKVGPRYSVPFFAAYFIYYAGYCVFSSYVILYLTDKGYSAVLCGMVTSLTLLANLAMEPLGGYVTDTFLSTRKYLALCIGLIAALCIFCTLFANRPALCMPALILTAGLAYPFSQLMDAWVNCSVELDPDLVYSRIRAGGSIGFSLMSISAGYYFRRFGWDTYFLVQGALFLMILPLLAKLPKIRLGNTKRQESGGTWLSLPASFQALAGNRPYLLCLLVCTVYWFSHRPVGSYLALLVEARSGDASVFGNICGVGAAVEFCGLLFLAWMQKKKPIPLWLYMTLALASDVLRPLCLWLLPGIWPLYLGQVIQAISFALFYSGSVECFTQTADSRIRSFSISIGLTTSSVVGTISANLLGGWLCDGWGTGSLILLSLGVSIWNCLLLFVCFSRLFSRNGAK
ncbi:MAG: MFS transporter [Lawsonibacter sp.]